MGIRYGAALGAMTIAMVSAMPVAAQQASADARHTIALPAQPLDESLYDLSRSTGLQLVFTDASLRKMRAPAVRGQLTARQALDLLLKGSGYTYRFVNKNTVRVLRASAAASKAAVGPISYTNGAQAGASATAASPPRPTAAEAVRNIVVTGSRIERDADETPTPITSVSEEEFDESGATELGEFIADLPAASSTLNDSTVAGNVQNSGLSAIQLRNLGDNRTLVLIDGRRTVSNSANANRVSTSTIPSSFIDRIEIITGGASSIYGSDAVAGVVNIITTDDRGFRLRTRGGITEHGDGEEFTIDGRWGTRFADGRGYFAVSGTYDRDYGIKASERDWAIRQASYDYDDDGFNVFETLYLNSSNTLTSGDQPASTFPPNELRDLSGFTPGGVFYAANSAQDRFYDANGIVPLGPDTQTGEVVEPGDRDDGNTGYFLPNRDGYNQRALRSLLLARERYLAAGKFDFDVSDATSLFGQVQYSRVDSGEIREPVGIGFDSTVAVFDPQTGTQTDVTIGRIPCRREDLGPCNPTVPYEVFANNFTSNTRGVAWDRRFVEVGGQETDNRRETLRSWLGARGEAWGDWRWEASAGYGVYTQNQFRLNEINGLALQQALDADVGPDGAIRCADAEARAEGCVPINLFGEGSITAEAADYIRADLNQRVTIKQQTFQGFMSGSVFDLPAGAVRGAFGIDYRKDSLRLRGDELSNIGGTTGNTVPDFGGSIAAMEGFGELNIPLLTDQPFFRLLSLDVSARVADYDIRSVGTVFSYRAGLQWAPVNDLRLRAQFARAQRAPDLAELYSPPRGDFDTVRDVCDGVSPTTAGRIAARCLEDPGIQAAIAGAIADGDEPEFDQGSSNIYSPNGGNLNLKEETADTLTVGAVFEPRFLPRLSISADYYDIDIADAISQYGNEDILLQCYDSDLPASDNPFCGDVARNPNNGRILRLTQRQFNVSSLETSGIDVAVRYRFDLSDSLGIPGRWDLRYDGTHILKQESRFFGLEGLVITDQRGDLSQGSFKYRGRATASWRLDGFRLRYTAKVLGKTLDSRIRLNAFQDVQAEVPDAEFPLFLRIPAVWEHDIFASYEFDVGSAETRIYAGVNNLFDRVSPFLPTGTSSGRLTNLNGNYDVAGRRFYVGAVLEF